MNREREAVALWKMLDDIDTLDDACRESDLVFRVSARWVARRRFELATSPDGMRLVWTHSQEEETMNDADTSETSATNQTNEPHEASPLVDLLEQFKCLFASKAPHASPDDAAKQATALADLLGHGVAFIRAYWEFQDARRRAFAAERSSDDDLAFNTVRDGVFEGCSPKPQGAITYHGAFVEIGALKLRNLYEEIDPAAAAELGQLIREQDRYVLPIDTVRDLLRHARHARAGAS